MPDSLPPSRPSAALASAETRHSVMLSAMPTSRVAVPSGPVMIDGLT
jgi:hypothetical protein